jgi:hypothetical protein
MRCTRFSGWPITACDIEASAKFADCHETKTLLSAVPPSNSFLITTGISINRHVFLINFDAFGRVAHRQSAVGTRRRQEVRSLPAPTILSKAEAFGGCQSLAQPVPPTGV